VAKDGKYVEHENFSPMTMALSSKLSMQKIINAVCSPSDTSTTELTNRENEVAISVSITLLGENNLRAVRVESNATEKIHSVILSTIFEHKRDRPSLIG
jgi:hypothetical protein